MLGTQDMNWDLLPIRAKFSQNCGISTTISRAVSTQQAVIGGGLPLLPDHNYMSAKIFLFQIKKGT
jgi:hypothetical protein